MHNLINFSHQKLGTDLLLLNIGMIFIIILSIIIKHQHRLFWKVPSFFSLCDGFENVLIDGVITVFNLCVSACTLCTWLSLHDRRFFRKLIRKLSHVCFLSDISRKQLSFLFATYGRFFVCG
jgi:hypothetical protein